MEKSPSIIAEFDKILPPDIVFPAIGVLMTLFILVVIFRALRENGMLNDQTQAEMEDARQRPATYAIKQFLNIFLTMLLVMAVCGFTSCGMTGMEIMLTNP